MKTEETINETCATLAEPDKSNLVKRTIENTHKHIALVDILSNLKLTKSLTKTAKLLDCSVPNISQRLKDNGINVEKFLDYPSAKDQIFEALQARLINAVNDKEVKKTPLGTKILAVCQLEDKIRLIRGQSTSNVAYADMTAEASEIETKRAKRAAEIERLRAELGMDASENQTLEGECE